ncbi:serine phosphatase RsbU, regulator of sigma subunit [Desulfuromonas soudanensis]|uniref:Serine phosphatase RsbU, regulator of sigma subunit n=1 Tax=Desulfuromonas soudanensis TaxID=1603606 RepID=A0A0M4CWZ9_9BACT|nr:SpoIIE family protein phosphatase [Desulfuromonas soudanensis]ALC16641.1 serine phosphatase RsbU, regulator of sigma subunit [Desulfuromonas soudanensis]
MGIRGKLLVLLLLISVVPLTINAAINHLSLHRFGRHLAAVTRTLLTDSAHAYLHQVVESYQHLQERDSKTVEAALKLESQQWRNRLESAEPEPNSPAIVFQFLKDFRPDLTARQYTFLASGTGFTYPSEENFPGSSDPRQLPWYEAAHDKMVLTRTLAIDPITGHPALFTAIPLLTPDGRFNGVTAISRPLSEVLRTMALPEAWTGKARAMLVMLEKGGGETPDRLRIVAAGAEGTVSPETGEGAYLEPDEPAEAGSLLKKITSGQAGTARIVFRGQETHWVFGAGREGEPLPVVIVSHDAIIDEALAAERHVQSKTIQGLMISGALLAAVVLIVVALAFASSRRVTRPLSQLAAAAQRLTGGDFQARAEIRTGDELEELGRIFNGLGPRLLERERMAGSLALAGEIQGHLLPTGPPPVAGLDIFGGVAYCDEAGGDYYDFIDLPKGRLGLAVGDVTGHGIGAALLMASARGILRSHAERDSSDLPVLFSALNRHLARDVGDERFMTLFYGVLDARDRSLRWCSAGHGPVFLFRSQSGAVEELETTGIPLGIMPAGGWEGTGPIVLESGDILLVGTDGLWEARDLAGVAFGTERLHTTILSRRQEAAAEIYAAAMEAVRVFRGAGRQEDDVTLVVVKVV